MMIPTGQCIGTLVLTARLVAAQEEPDRGERDLIEKLCSEGPSMPDQSFR
jgi:hypothetical protein